MRTIVNRVKSKFFNRKGAKFSFAQAGEDIVLQRIFLGSKKGFYVDVGAYHPFKLSNTYLFYLDGWTGINIEPRPGSRQLFEKHRPKDINLELGIGDASGFFNYHNFEEDTFNQFGFANSVLVKNVTNKVQRIKTMPLSSILDRYAKQKIDFMTIDTEGAEYQILSSNNWVEFLPTVVLIEQNRDNKEFNKVCLLLKDQGYKEVYRIPVNACADSVFFLKE